MTAPVVRMWHATIARAALGERLARAREGMDCLAEGAR